VQLHKAVSDVTGMTGVRIRRAIVAGERDVYALARLRDRHVKATEEQAARALEGTYREEHMLALSQALEGYDFFQQQLRASTRRSSTTSKSCPLHSTRLR
jgi:hypothetical protein